MDIIKSHENIFKELKLILTGMEFNKAEYYSQFCSLNFIKGINQVSNHIKLQLFNDSLGINYLQGHILLNEVNEILGKFVNLKGNNEFITLKDYINKEKLTNKLQEINMTLKNRNKSQYLIDIINHIKNLIIPFFEKYPDIEAINNEIINKVPQKEYTNYITGKTNFKVLIIMKLCKNPKYGDFRNWALEVYKRGIEIDKTKYGADYEILQSLISYLDNEQYIT